MSHYLLNRRLHILLLCLLALCTACSKPVPHLAQLAPDAVILAFGDSITAGTGANDSESYPTVLATLTGRRVINAGVPGEISASGVSRLNEILDREQPQLLVLCHGGNDLLRRLDTQQTSEHLRTMIKAAQDRGIAVLLIGVPEPKLFNRHSAAFYAEIATEFSIPIEIETLARIEGDSALKSDGIHPNARGYRQLAQAVYDMLQRAGAL